MIQKIKELMRVKEEIKELESSISENRKSSNELKSELSDLKKQLKEMQASQSDFLKTLKEDMRVLHNLREDFGKELYEFKLLKGQMQRKILDRFEEEMQKDLQLNRDLLKKDTEDYNDLRVKVGEILSRVNLTSGEIGKFMEISKSIKKEDFELTKFAKQLIEMDKEKLELLRKIDTLERLVSKIRRNQITR